MVCKALVSLPCTRTTPKHGTTCRRKEKMSKKIQFTREEKLRHWQYHRILEILNDYWLDEPEETYVEVAMYFEKRRGEETQTKHIRWGYPSIVEVGDPGKPWSIADFRAGKVKEETMFVLNPEWENMKEGNNK